MNITDLNDDVLLLIVDAIADIDAKVGKRKVAKLVALPLASFAITCKKLHALTAPKLFCKLLHGCYDANCGRAIDRRTSDNDLKFLSKSNTILRCCRYVFYIDLQTKASANHDSETSSCSFQRMLPLVELDISQRSYPRCQDWWILRYMSLSSRRMG